MNKKVCRKCGGDDFISDRSLGGKIICMSCGSSSFRNKNFFNIVDKNILYLILISIVILLIIL